MGFQLEGAAVYGVAHGNGAGAFGWQIGMFGGAVPNANTASSISQAVTTGGHYFKIRHVGASCRQSAEGICLLSHSR